MDEIKAIADKMEGAGNTIDVALYWLQEGGVGGNTIDELVGVMESCLGSAVRLREIAAEGC